MRSSLFRWARKLVQGDWERVVGACLTDARKRTLGAMTVNQAFSRRSSPLNFVELLQFVRESGDFAVAGVTTDEICKAINTVNQWRIDAHAKGIGDAEYATVLHALDLLEAVFLPPE